MKKNLFSKCMATYFVMILISYILVAVFLNYWLESYYYNQKIDSLIKGGTYLNNIVVEYIYKNIGEDELKFRISAIESLSDAHVVVYDNYGYEYDRYNKSQGNINKQLEPEVLQVVRSGVIYRKTVNNVHGFTPIRLTIGIPVVLDNNQVVGSIFLYAQLDEIKNIIKQVSFLICMCAFFTILISVFIIYYTSNKILIKPLMNINQSAKNIASGEFDKRVDLDSEDEIGDLAVSFNYMTDSLQNLEVRRKTFITNISHELRSPMTSINGFITGMLDSTIPDEKWNYYLTIVSGEIKRLTRLINEITDLVRLESSEFSFNVGTFDINELVREKVISFEGRISKKECKMEVILVGSKLWVIGDRDRIDQVISNLLDNAIKFVADSGFIRVKTEIKDDRVVVSIFNTGLGIPKEEIKYIWERFHKVDKARSKGQGTGLGLSIARQIINQHNQTIWVESCNEWTEFFFTLKLSKF